MLPTPLVDVVGRQRFGRRGWGVSQPTAFSLFLPGLDLVLAHALSPRHADFFFLFGATCSGLAFTTASSAISITFKTPMTSVPLAWFSS